MLQFSNFDYNFSKNPNFGALTGGQRLGGGLVQKPQESENIFKPASTPAVSNEKTDTGLVGRLNAIDSQTITPNNKSDVLGQKLYCFA